MQRNKATNTLPIQTDLFSSRLYDNRDDFDFDIVNFPYLEEDFPALLFMVVTFLNVFVLLKCLGM